MTTTRLAPPAPVKQRRAATFEPASYDAATDSYEVVWTTGAPVLRDDWRDGYYTEVLSTNPAAVRLGRLNAGAAFLDSHQDRQLASVIGSVVPGSARMAAGRGICRVRLADTPDVADTVAKIKAGHVRNVSVGYAVFVFERTEPAGEWPTMTAVDWEPREISACAVGADPNCQIRSEPNMTDTTTTTTETSAPTATTPVGRFVTAARISEACATAALDDAEELAFLREHSATPMTEATLTRRITEAYAARTNPAPIDNSRTAPAYTGQRGSPDHLRQRMAGAIRARLAGTEPPAESREFMGATVIDMVRGLMMARGERAQYWSPATVYERHGAMTTSDMPLLLQTPLAGYFNELYAAEPPALQALARPRKVRDFRPVSSVDLTGDNSLPYIAENGEYTYAAFAEGGQQYKVNTFGKIFSISRQAIINDNLGALTQMGAQFVRRASIKRADILAAINNNNVPIADIATKTSTPLFDASRGNLAAVGGDLNVATLSAARLAMRTQKDKTGATLGIRPRYLVVGPELETLAEQVLAIINAASIGEVNPFSGKLELLVEPRLIGRAWYLFADPRSYPVLEFATIEGEDDVFTDTRLGWNVDGLETKVRIDYGATAVDGLGAYKNPGPA